MDDASIADPFVSPRVFCQANGVLPIESVIIANLCRHATYGRMSDLHDARTCMINLRSLVYGSRARGPSLRVARTGGVPLSQLPLPIQAFCDCNKICDTGYLVVVALLSHRLNDVDGSRILRDASHALADLIDNFDLTDNESNDGDHDVSEPEV